ncbi:cytochrome b562 [Testudinibacter sp. P27/CKL/0425]
MNIKQMWKTGLLGAALVVATLSSGVASANLKDDMRTIAGNATTALKTESTQEFVQSLQNLSKAAESAKQFLPYSLHDQAKDSEAVLDYQSGLQQLIDVSAESVKFAEQGDLAQAKKQAEKLIELRDAFHKKYK